MNVPKSILYGGCVAIGLALGSAKQFAFPRYRIYVHDLGTAGAHMPVFLKFDNREGRAWKNTGVDLTWREVSGDEIKSGASFTPPPLDSEEKPVRDVAGR